MDSIIMKYRPNVVQVVLALTALLGIWLAVAHSFSTLAESLVTGAMWGLIAGGLSLVFGVMNVPNFAIGEFFMLGTLGAYYGYSAMERSNASSLLTWLVSLAVGAAVGVISGLVVNAAIMAPMRRFAGRMFDLNAFVATAALGTVLINLHYLVFGAQFKGISGFFGLSTVDVFGSNISLDRLSALAVAIVVFVALTLVLRYTRPGRSLRAVSQDAPGALMMGIDISRVRALSFALSTGIAAIAGAALLFLFPSSPYVGGTPLQLAWTVLILTGMGSVSACLIGGLMIALFETATAVTIGTQWGDVVPLVVVTMILIFKPLGLFGRSATRT